MVNYISMAHLTTYAVFILLSISLFLGDEKQSTGFILISGLLLILYATDWIYKKRTYVIKKTTAISWIVLSILLFVSSLSSLSLGYAISEIVKYLCAFLLYLYFSNRHEEDNLDIFLKIFLYWSALVLAVSFVYWLIPSLKNITTHMNLLYMQYGHNHIVNILIFVIPYSIYKFSRYKSVKNALFVTILIVGTVFSNSRGALLLVGVGFLSAGLKYLRPKQKHTKIMLIVLFAVLFMSVVANSMISRMNSLTQSRTNTVSLKASIIDSRFPYWKQSVSSFRKKPFFGNGPGSFYLISKKYQTFPNSYSWYAHSLPLQILSEIGIFGLLTTAILIYSILGKVSKELLFTDNNLSLRLSAYLGIASVLLYSFIEINLDFSVTWALLWILLGLIHKSENEKGLVSINISSGKITLLCTTLFIYTVIALMGTYFLYGNQIQRAVILMPYNARVVESYLSSKTPDTQFYASIKPYLYLLHSHNSDILLALANKETNDESYFYYMREAITSDPQNRTILENYIQKSLKLNRIEDLKQVVQIMISTISVNVESDVNYLNNNWNNIHECFNTNTLIWNDTPYTDTYQAKALYFASLCLLKKKDIHNAKALLRIATDSLPGWSYIYIDYAALLWWYDIDYVEAMKIIELCKKNIHAKNHCSEFDTGNFLNTSVYDKTIIVEN